MQNRNIISEDKLHRLREFCLMDDTFMAKFFEKQLDCTELIMNIIL